MLVYVQKAEGLKFLSRNNSQNFALGICVTFVLAVSTTVLSLVSLYACLNFFYDLIIENHLIRNALCQSHN